MNHRIPATLYSLLGLAFSWLGQVPGVAEEFQLGRSDLDSRSHARLQSGVVYDGSNADRVDDFLRKVPENSAIRLGAYVFDTCGVWDIYLVGQEKGFRLKSGWVMTGAGTNSTGGTVLRLVDVPVDETLIYNCNVVISTGAIGLYTSDRPAAGRPNVENVTIRDLQVDCNYPGLAKAKGNGAFQVAGIQILGNRGLKLINVLIRNGASKRLTHAGEETECFQVYFYNPWATNYPGDYLVDRVAVADYQGGYTSAICVNGNATGSIQNCTVDLASDRSQRYGLNFAAGLHHFTLTNNTVYSATRGINNDTGPACTNVLIISNQLVRCSTGMLLANSQGNRVVGNTISMDGRGCGIAIRYHPTMEHVKSGRCFITDNVIYGDEGEGISLGYQNEFDRADRTLYWSSNNVIQNNVFSPGLQSKIPPAALAPNNVVPGNRRHLSNLPARGLAGEASNLAAIGFPSDLGPGADCPYCPLEAVDPSGGYIARVKLSGTRMDMRSNGRESAGYSDFTTGYASVARGEKYKGNYHVQWADLRRGKAYRIGVYSAELKEPERTTFQVYIDWDHSGRFDTPRELVAFGSRRSTLAGPLLVPPTAPLGSTRMRVVMAVGMTPSPCDSRAFAGEVEDYTVNVVP